MYSVDHLITSYCICQHYAGINIAYCACPQNEASTWLYQFLTRSDLASVLIIPYAQRTRAGIHGWRSLPNCNVLVLACCPYMYTIYRACVSHNYILNNIILHQHINNLALFTDFQAHYSYWIDHESVIIEEFENSELSDCQADWKQ